ncbi:MAG: hypothetical protein WCS17_10415 [Prevotella sp.]
MLKYNNDYQKMKLPQVSFYLVHSMNRNMSVGYRLFLRSIVNKTTLEEVLTAISESSSEAHHVVKDRGFCGPDNLDFMLENDIALRYRHRST